MLETILAGIKFIIAIPLGLFAVLIMGLSGLPYYFQNNQTPEEKAAHESFFATSYTTCQEIIDKGQDGDDCYINVSDLYAMNEQVDNAKTGCLKIKNPDKKLTCEQQIEENLKSVEEIKKKQPNGPYGNRPKN